MLKQEVAAARADQLWLYQVHCEIEQLEMVEKQIKQVEAKLQEIAEQHPSVKRLQEVPCVGPRLSEAVLPPRRLQRPMPRYRPGATD